MVNLLVNQVSGIGPVCHSDSVNVIHISSNPTHTNTHTL